MTTDHHGGRSRGAVRPGAEPAPSVGAVPVCVGCGLAGDVSTNNGLCGECWQRRERAAGGGRLLVVTPAGTYHETPRCPGVQVATEWRFIREEDAMYADMGGDLEKCLRCHQARLYEGFDRFTEGGARASARQYVGHGSRQQSE